MHSHSRHTPVCSAAGPVIVFFHPVFYCLLPIPAIEFHSGCLLRHFFLPVGHFHTWMQAAGYHHQSPVRSPLQKFPVIFSKALKVFPMPLLPRRQCPTGPAWH